MSPPTDSLTSQCNYSWLTNEQLVAQINEFAMDVPNYNRFAVALKKAGYNAKFLVPWEWNMWYELLDTSIMNEEEQHFFRHYSKTLHDLMKPLIRKQ